MPACRRDLQRTLDVFLPLYIPEIRQRQLRLLRLPRHGRRKRRFARQMRHKLAHGLHAVDGKAVRQRCLGGVRLRDIELRDAKLPRRQRHRQHAAHRPKLALKAQLPQKRALRLRQSDRAACRQDSQQDGQVIERAALFRPRRSQIQRDAADREFEAAVFDRRPDALTRLLDRRVGKPDHVKRRKSVCDKALDRDLIALDPLKTHRAYMTEHCAPSPSSSYLIYHTAFSRKFQQKIRLCGKKRLVRHFSPETCEFSTSQQDFSFTLTRRCAMISQYNYVITRR